MLRFWTQTEIHVYAFSVAANILLSFFPFLIVIMSLCLHVFKWKAAVDAIFFALNDYFPGPISDYIGRNLRVVVASRGPFQAISVLVLLFTANGVFQPLEVALNRIWKCSTDRSYWKNQLVSLGLIFACGGLILFSTMLTAANNQLLAAAAGRDRWLTSFLEQTFYKLAAIPLSMLMLFLIYWMLPNCKISPAAILPAAVGVGLLLEVLKYINLLTWPYLRPKFAAEYGPFTYAATIILWGFFASMLILAGAHWAAQHLAAVAQPEFRTGVANSNSPKTGV
jgi:YihY family inner membrane protein